MCTRDMCLWSILSILLGTMQVFNILGTIVLVTVLDINWRGLSDPKCLDTEAKELK